MKLSFSSLLCASVLHLKWPASSHSIQRLYLSKFLIAFECSKYLEGFGLPNDVKITNKKVIDRIKCVCGKLTFALIFSYVALCAVFLLFGAPNFQTSLLFMTYLTTCHTLYDIFFFAFACLMAKFIALETKFFCAFIRLMVVFSAKNTIESRSIVWTLSSHVTKFSASKTLYCDVRFQEVPVRLTLHFSKHVIYLSNSFLFI